MNEKIHKALKRIIASLDLEHQRNYLELPEDIKQIENWLNEVAKQYEGDEYMYSISPSIDWRKK